MIGQEVFLQRALVASGLIAQSQLDEALRYARDKSIDLVDALADRELVTSREVALTRSDICEVAFVELSDFEPCFSNVSIIPRRVAERCCAYPLFKIDNVLTVAMDDPLNLDATDQIRQLARCEVDTVIADRTELRALISKAYSLGGDSSHAAGAGDDVVDGDDDDEDRPIVNAVTQILVDAIEDGASDVHINPDEKELHLRYRIDGVLRRKQGPPLSMHAGIVQRLKVMANLDLTQTRRPQDGKFRFSRHGRAVDVRMSTLPTVCGENVVLRLLANARQFANFEELGLPTGVVQRFETAIRQPHGMILVTGPTGSGKTTTLYTALARLNDPARNIMTIEDPVEIRMEYVRQIQVNHEIGLVFASALRSILRQDPDVILVGEIRDEETAMIAVQAALTGHLVLSTLHTNDAVGAVARLRDYGLPPFVVNSSVLGIMAQRLVRRICPRCCAPDEIDELVRRRFGLGANDHGFVQGKGCGRCGQSGFRGRLGIYEYLDFNSRVRSAVENGASTEQIRRDAIAAGMRLMWQDGLEKAQLGLTSLDEIAKVAMIESDLPEVKAA